MELWGKKIDINQELLQEMGDLTLPKLQHKAHSSGLNPLGKKTYSVI